MVRTSFITVAHGSYVRLRGVGIQHGDHVDAVTAQLGIVVILGE